MKKNKNNKILNFLHNPWVVGVAFYLLGLLTPKTIPIIKEFSFIKKTIHIDVVGNYYESANENLNNLYFIVFLLVLLYIISILLEKIFSKED